MKKISRLHFITTNAVLAEQACKGGVDWVQLRLKNTGYDDFLQIAKEVQTVCKKYNATFIINDNIEIAKELNADGVHIGKEDMIPEKAREILGDTFIIGCSAHTQKDILSLSKKQVDYIGLGPFRFTKTKERLSPVLGLRGYKRIMGGLQKTGGTKIPIVAIGGIKETDSERIFSTGIHGIAVSSTISESKDVVKAAKSFKTHIAAILN